MNNKKRRSHSIKREKLIGTINPPPPGSEVGIHVLFKIHDSEGIRDPRALVL
jgi:hypothetical protein